MKETELRIRVLGDPVLRKKSRRITEVTREHRDILDKMVKLMHQSSGIGLAAPQVGINQAMIVVDIGRGLYKLVNPRITLKKGSQTVEEGCLSVPGACIKVRRAKVVTIEALDEFGKSTKIEAVELLACVFQHEIDHLLGKLIVDYASVFERLKLNKRFEELRNKCRDENLSESREKYYKLQL
jgi:peptide deformylase